MHFPNFKFDKLCADKIEGNPDPTANSKKFVSSMYYQGSADITRHQKSNVLAIRSCKFVFWAIKNALGIK